MTKTVSWKEGLYTDNDTDADADMTPTMTDEAWLYRLFGW